MGLTGKKVVVVGMGRSALGAVRLLLHQGACPFVTDAADGPDLLHHKENLAALGVPFETGGHGDGTFADAAAIILSPGVPPSVSPVAAARERGVPVLGELEYASRFCTMPILAVSGTNGKTTVTELLRHVISTCGRGVALAGNNDTPLSDVALLDPAPDFAVVEVSSYQLETCSTFHPRVAAILNLTPDHLGRHGTMEGYAQVKARIFARQTAGDVAIVNADDPWTRVMEVSAGVRRMTFSLEEPQADGLHAAGDTILHGEEPVASLADNPLPGRHNLANVLAALAVARAVDLPWDSVLEGLRSFQGVEHRIEPVRELAGVRWYNDSKSTNVDSLRVALESFDAPIVLIAGGRGKGSDYGVLSDLVRARVKHLVAIGEDAPLLEAAFGDLVQVSRADSMKAAVLAARGAASRGGIALLSPGCASFDWYANFEQRGADFKRVVSALREEEVA